MRVIRLLILFTPLCAPAMELSVNDVDYDPATHDVYSSGYPGAPVRNTSASFVGTGWDPVPAAWSSSDPTKGFGLVSPAHYLVARHYGGASSLRIFGADQQLHTRNQQSVEATSLGVVLKDQTLGDLSLGTLTTPFPQAALHSRMGVLDLHDRSSTDSAGEYAGIPLHVFGRDRNSTGSSRLAESFVSSVILSGNNQYYTFSRTPVRLQVGDSGSPTFAAWTNPDGQPEHAVLGNHAAIDTDNGLNFDNFAASREVILALNTRMKDDGRSLRVVGNPALDWEGVDDNNLSAARAWGENGNPRLDDLYARFSGDLAGNGRVVNVDAAFDSRGLYFTSTGSSTLGFTFQGSSILEIGRGGITNYDLSTQTLTAPLRLTHDQYWDVGSGGIEIHNLDTIVHHLELGGAGTTTISGTVSGSGSMAVDQGIWIQNGPATYTGDTWVHEATARINADLTSSPELHLAEKGNLSGSGNVSVVIGNGTIAPGTGTTVLTATQLFLIPKFDFEFQFTAESPDFASASNSGNDVLRVTSIIPFSSPLDAQSTLRVYLDPGAHPSFGDQFRGGFFTDYSADFLASISSASIEIYVQDGAGSISYEGQTYSLYSGDGDWEITTVDQAADFGAGTVNGRILQLQLLPPAGTYARWTYEAFPESVPVSERDPDDSPNPANLENIYSYAFELDPTNPDVSGLPYVGVQNGNLELYFRQRTSPHEIEYLFDTTEDLQSSWTGEALVPVEVDADPDGNGEVSLMKVSRPIGTADNLFLRLRTPLTIP